MTSSRVEAVVVGAGMSGLSCAYRLQQCGKRVVLFEGSDRVGGNVWTVRDDAFLRECGPNAFDDAAEPLMKLVRELSLEDQIVRAPDLAGRRFLFVGDRLRRVPSNPVAFLGSRVLPLGARLRLFCEPFVARRAPDLPEETLAQFCDRRLGRAARLGLVTPIVSGITAGDPERLSAASAFPKLVEWERSHRSLIRGAIASRGTTKRGRLSSFVNGLETLTDALAARLGDAVRLRSPVTAIERDGNGFAVTAGDTIEARRVVVATPPRAAADLLRPLAPGASEALAAIDTPPLVVAHAELERSASMPDAFGFLAPRGQGVRILGAIFSSRLFEGRAPADSDLVTVFLGGALDRDATLLDDDAVRRLVAADLARALPGSPCRSVRLHRWAHSIPQYELGHEARIAAIDAALADVPGLAVIGAYRDGIALPTRAAAGEAAAQAILA